MMSSPLMKIVCFVSWLVTGLVSVVVGLRALEYDATLHLPMLQTHPMPVLWIILVSGVISLLSLVKMVVAGHCCDHSK